MKRLYETVIAEHFAEDKQMLFFAGPRQVGKTTVSLSAKEFTDRFVYLNWDIQEHRLLILEGPTSVGKLLNLEQPSEKKPLIVFDEIHKHPKWKLFLKGFYDLFKDEAHIIVTGSSRLDVYQKGGDSLMGRYFPYRVHPFSVAECLSTALNEQEFRKAAPISDEEFNALWEYGGFPEPFIKRNKSFSEKWNATRSKQLLREDIQDLTQIREIAQLEMLAEVLTAQVGQLLNYTSLAKKVLASPNTVRAWIKVLEAFYHSFLVRPWTKNVTRSLLKDPKIYLWDWAGIQEKGARAENFVASHLLKAVNLWTDRGLGEYKLHFVRDKEKREVDFLVVKNKKPWFLVEVKHKKNSGISQSLHHFCDQLNPSHAFQVIIDEDYVDIDCFSYHRPVIVPARTLLSQLV